MLTGVIDDRGRYICINESERNHITDVMTKNGRISALDLTKAINKIINQTPKRTETDI